MQIGDVTGPTVAHGHWFDTAEQAMRLGWRWGRDARCAWALKHVFGRKGEDDAEWARIEAAAATQPDPWFANRSRVLSAWAGVLESGVEHQDFRFRRAVTVRVGAGWGHAHNDTLDLNLFAHGCVMAPDGGQNDELTHNTPNVQPIGMPQEGERHFEKLYLRKFDIMPERKWAGDGCELFVATWRLNRDKIPLTWNGQKYFMHTAAEPMNLGASYDQHAPRKFTRLHLFGAARARILGATYYNMPSPGNFSNQFDCVFAQERSEQNGMQTVFVALIDGAGPAAALHAGDFPIESALRIYEFGPGDELTLTGFAFASARR